MRRVLIASLVLFCLVPFAEAASSNERLRNFPSLRAQDLMKKTVPQNDAEEAAREEVVDRGGLGPTPDTVFLRDEVTIEQLELFEGLGIEDLTRYSLYVYPDANPDSGIYYYRPRKFHLLFDPATAGYYLDVQFKEAAESGENVLIQARLTPGADRTDREVLLALLEQYAANRRKPKPQLLPFPAQYTASFDLTDWNIDSVTVNGVDPDSGEIVLTLSADVPTKELVTSTLGNANGLVGTVRMEPVHETMTSPIELTAEIRLADLSGGPRLRWKRPSGDRSTLANPWPFDLQLHHLCYLYRQSRGALTLRGWELGEEVLAPGDTAELTRLDLNKELEESRVLTAFYHTSLLSDDDSVWKVVDELTSGLGAPTDQTLTIEVFNPGALFEQYDIYKLVVEVRSAHFDPEGREIETHSYEIRGSEDLLNTDPLYLWDDPGGSALYQHRLGVVTLDGVFHGGSTWNGPNPRNLYTIDIGSVSVEEALAQ